MSVVADTHILHWYFADPSRLSGPALDRLYEEERNESAGIAVSVASRIDLHYLAAVGRLDAALCRQLWAVTGYPDVNVRAIPITAEIAERFGDPDLQVLRDPWDRLIVATAIELDVPLITADGAIRALGESGVVEIIW